MNRFFRSAGVYIVILLVTVGIVNFIANQGQETDNSVQRIQGAAQ